MRKYLGARANIQINEMMTIQVLTIDCAAQSLITCMASMGGKHHGIFLTPFLSGKVTEYLLFSTLYASANVKLLSYCTQSLTSFRVSNILWPKTEMAGSPSANLPPVKNVEKFRQPFRAAWRCQSSSFRTCFSSPDFTKSLASIPSS